MSLEAYRVSDSEKMRTNDLVQLIELIANSSEQALDIGARDGHFSKLMVEHYESCTALDLERPSFEHAKVHCVQGDITGLDFSDNSFELVFCAEVLEHIPPHLLEKACSELGRVSKKFLLIGVPYKQDIRVGRTTCGSCGTKNPPWGHVNSFDENRLLGLFSSYEVKKTSFVGENNASTNSISTFLMDLAGNPYGTYRQEEACIRCDKKLTSPAERNLLQKLCTKAAYFSRNFHQHFSKPHPNWIHVLFEKKVE